VSYFKYSRKKQNKIRLSTAMVLKEASFHQFTKETKKNHRKIITEYRMFAILFKAINLNLISPLHTIKKHILQQHNKKTASKTALKN